MTRSTVCIYHANCADGFTAAWVVANSLGHRCKFIAANYGDAAPDVADCDVILVDFSYKRSVLEYMAREARTVLVLDHHESAEKELEGFPKPFTPLSRESRWMAHTDTVAVAAYRGEPACLFDMQRSGAQLAWDFFQPDLPRHPLVDYVADRDLWAFELPNSRAVSAWIATQNMDFGTWQSLANEASDTRLLATLVRQGNAIKAVNDKMIADALIASARSMCIGGTTVPVANVPYTMASEAGHFLAEEAEFSATYFDTAAGQRKFSLRSRGRVNVAEIARSYGGGGHPNAAGFTMPLGWEGDAPDGGA